MFHLATTPNHYSSSRDDGGRLTTLPKPSVPKMFKKRQRSTTAAARPTVRIEDLSDNLVPILGTKPLALVLHGILTAEECAGLVARAEDEGFDDALITGPGGKQILAKDVRSCRRCIVDDVGLADALYVRITNALRGTEFERKVARAPWVTAGSPDGDAIQAVGLNERLRFLKYEPGHFFSPHRDLRYVRGPDCGARAGETSHVTVQLYLNEKFKGGTTRFLNGRRHYDVKPKTGSVLIFDHDLLHEGSQVVGGTKYSVRTDVMYTPPGRAEGA